MFTGIIEAVGVVRSARAKSGGKVLCVDIGPLGPGTRPADSIAVSGVCLTVSQLAGGVAAFDISPHTLANSTLGRLTAGAKVNLERALGADGRFGGHIVQGHVDGTAQVACIERQADFWQMTFHADSTLLEGLVPKGSVAVDGISLTVARMDERGFAVALIPTTIQRTTLTDARTGDLVNVETDILVRTIQAQLARVLGQERGLSIEKLREHGF